MFSLIMQRVSGSALRRPRVLSIFSTHPCPSGSRAMSDRAEPPLWDKVIKTAHPNDLPPQQQWKYLDLKKSNLQPPLGPYAGRSVTVVDGNLAQAFHYLSMRLRQNRVMQEHRYQRRHEKKGDKRRRLRSERWRKQFANVVRQKVQLVHAIRGRCA